MNSDRFALTEILWAGRRLIQEASLLAMDVLTASGTLEQASSRRLLTARKIIQDHVQQGLRRDYPHFPVMLSQDTPLLLPSAAYFRLEPLMVRNNDVSIHLAFLDHHTPVFGIIAFPRREVMVWGMLDDGVSIRSLTTDEEHPLIAPDFKRGTGIRSSPNPFTILHVAFGTLDRVTTRTALPSGCLAALYAMVKAGGGLVLDLNGQPLSSIDPPPQPGLQWLRSPEFALNHKKPVM